jgi:hypothetical protein
MCTRSAGAQGLPGGRKHTEREGAVDNAGLLANLNKAGIGHPKGQLC